MNIEFTKIQKLEVQFLISLEEIVISNTPIRKIDFRNLKKLKIVYGCDDDSDNSRDILTAKGVKRGKCF